MRRRSAKARVFTDSERRPEHVAARKSYGAPNTREPQIAVMYVEDGKQGRSSRAPAGPGQRPSNHDRIKGARRALEDGAGSGVVRLGEARWPVL